MEERSYAESLKAGLEDAVAFINGDIFRGRVITREVQISECKEEALQ